MLHVSRAPHHGGSGTLGRAFARACDARRLAYRATTHAELDVTDEAAVERALDETNASAVVNASGYVRVDDAERDEALAALSRGETVKASTYVVSPTYVVDLAEASLDLLSSNERGVFHLANRGAISWVDLARLAARIAGVRAGRVERCTGGQLGWTAERPAYSALATERSKRLPSLEDALDRYARA